MSTHQGLLHPTLVATLAKRAGHGKPLPNKWTPRRFELKGSSLYYYATNKPQAPRGSIQLTLTLTLTLTLIPNPNPNP